MVLTKATIGFLALTASALAPSTILAWGNEGHQVIALIAADRLTPAARPAPTRLRATRPR